MVSSTPAPYGGPNPGEGPGAKGDATVQIIVSHRHTEVPAALVDAVQAKVGRLERFDHDVRLAEVHFTHEATARAADREQCEVLLVANGERFQCKVCGPDGFAALDGAVAKLEQQLSRSRTRRLGRVRSA